MSITAKIRPTLRLDFTDFGCINKIENWFTRILRRDFTVEINDKPDLLIFQEGGHLNRLYTCRKLFWTGESILPDWKRTDYALSCHYIDDPRNLRFPYYVWGSEATAGDLIKRPGEASSGAVERQHFCSAVISNANRRRTTNRVEFFKKLHARKPLLSGGRFMNNIGEPLPIGGRPKLAFNQSCKFHLCFENKELPGYTTEKLVDAMWARCIPIYWGNPLVDREFNTKSMLCRYDFPDDQTFIEKILEADQDPALYAKIQEQPYFHNNTPNTFYDESRLLEFFHRIVDDRTRPVSQRRRFWHFGRWRLAKRMHF
jgi:hypothetical protein